MKRKSLILLTLALSAGVLTGCGDKEPDHVHTFNSFWSSNASQHWHGASCEHKDQKADVSDHVDTDNNGKCDVCGHDMSHEHTFSTNWTSDDTYHWHAATCGHDVVNGKAEHVDNNGNGTCDVCEHAMQPVIQEVVISVTNGTGGGTYVVGDSVTITANTAPEGKKFKEWQVNGTKVSTSNPYTFIASVDATYEAIYEDLPVDTVSITVTNGTGGGEYAIGASVTVTAIVAEGYTFKEWQVNGEKVSNDNPYTFVASSNLTLVAITEQDNPMAKYSRTLTMTGDTFKVLNLTDTQLSDREDFDSVEHIIDTLVEREQPDMITLLGDIINDDDAYDVKTNAQKTVALLDSYDIPWAPIFGNHDNLEYKEAGSKKSVGVPYLMDLFADCDNCLFIEGPEGIQGKSNYMVNIVDTNGDMVETFVFLDSYTNGLQDSNVDFYEDCIEYATELNGGEVVPSVMFDHIPILEYKNAYQNAIDTECHNLVGLNGATPLAAGTDKMFSKIKELGSTTSIICGHDHESAFITEYEGVNFTYAMKSSLGDNKNDNNYAHPEGGLVLEIGSGKDNLYFNRVEDITYELAVGKNLAFHPGVLNYWRFSGAKLAFDIEMPETGHLKFNIMGSNFQRATISEKDRKGEWNRFTTNVDLGTDVADLCDFGTMTQIEGNLYHYEADLSKWTLNSGEDAYGDETAKLVYMHSVTGGNFKITNIHWEPEVVEETNQLDLANAVIENIPEQSYFGLPVKPNPTVTLGGKTLVEGDDIIYDYSNHYGVGTGTLRVIPSGKGAHKYKGSITKTFSIVQGKEIKGEPFKAGVDFVKDIEAVSLDKTYNVDIKFTNGDDKHVNICLGDGWGDYFGYYKLTSSTKSGDYQGLTVSSLEDDYIRYSFNIPTLNFVNNVKGGDKSGIKKITLFYIRGDWSTAAGYVDLSVGGQGEVLRGEEFTGGNNFSKDIDAVAITNHLTIDFKFKNGSDKHINMFLGDGWANYYGLYKITPATKTGDFNGITVEELDDGYLRFVFTFSQMTYVNNEEGGDKSNIKKINLVHIRGDWSDANGYIDIIKEEQPVDEHRGTLVTSGSTTLSCYPYDVNEAGTLTIDYTFADTSTDSGKGLNLYVGVDLTHCYGKFVLFEDHLQTSYTGVTFEALEDGYNRITFDIPALTDIASGATEPNKVSTICFKYFEPTQGVYFDVDPLGNGKEVVLTMTDSDFKVATFTDIHIQKAADIASGSDVRKTIEYGMSNSEPDAVVFTGDFIHVTSDVSLVDDLCEFMDTFNTPYFFIFGNHDREQIDAHELAEHIWDSEYGYIDLGPSSLGKGGNYLVKIENSTGDLVHALIMMDTRNKNNNDPDLIEYVESPVNGVSYGAHGGKTTYCADGWDGVRGSQIDWYKDKVTELGCETSVFMHAGMNEYVKAYEAYRKAVISGDTEAIAAFECIGTMGEACCGPNANYGFFDAIKEMNSTKNVICGHDHVNDFSLLYEGVRLSYALKCGDGAYGGTPDKSGYSLLTINDSGSTSFNHVYYDYTK